MSTTNKKETGDKEDAPPAAMAAELMPDAAEETHCDEALLFGQNHQRRLPPDEAAAVNEGNDISGKNKLPNTSTLAHHVAGVWTRLWEEDPLGSGILDQTTLVAWTQAPCGMYIDLRLPESSPGISLQAAVNAGFVTPKPLALLGNNDSMIPATTAEQREVFLKQKSFAGYLMFAFGDCTDGKALVKDAELAKLSKQNTAAIPLCTCFWRRDMDYQPPGTDLDVGVCVSSRVRAADGTLDLRETGQDGSYAEGWRRLAGTAEPPYCALELVQENGIDSARKGFWVRTGHRFAYTVGRPETKGATVALNCEPGSHRVVECVGKTLVEAVTTTVPGDDEESGLRQAWSYIAAVGSVREDGSWYIESSTRPDLVGCLLLGGGAQQQPSYCCSTLTKISSDDDDGDYVVQWINNYTSGPPSKHFRKWRVVEMSSDDAIFAQPSSSFPI